MKHNQYVEIKQFFKVGIQQNGFFIVIWLIKFLIIIAGDPRRRVAHIFAYITKYLFSQTSNHIFGISTIRIPFILIIRNVHKELSSLRLKI